MTQPINAIEDLVGEEVSSVIFVTDYVQIDFGGPRLTAFADPAIAFGSERAVFPQAGSRDLLCKAILSTVTQVEVIEHVECRLVTANGVHIQIPLDGTRQTGPEAMLFNPDNRNAPFSLYVW